VRESVSVGSACDCAANQRVPVQAIVAARQASNDDALIGLDPGALAGGAGARLDLPCGNYYLSAITATPAAIVAHGNVALYVAGDVTSNLLSLTLDPASQFDVFIAGSLCSSGALTTGSPNYPAQMRLYVGGNGGCANTGNSIRFSGPSNFFSGNVYAENGYTVSSPSTTYGAISTGAYVNSASATIHFDRAVLGQGGNCGGPVSTGCSSCQDCNNQACINGQCGACVSSSQCCAPLVCNEGSCQPAKCAGRGADCTKSDDCCTGLVCLDSAAAPCSGTGCTCHSMFK
jgi:hypothetical protein